MNRRDSGTIKCIARQKLMGKYALMICAVIMANLITSVLSSICNSVMSANTAGAALAYYAAQLIISILTGLLSTGIVYMLLRIVRGQQALPSDLFFALRNHPDRYILANILQTIIFMLPLLPGTLVLYSAVMPDAVALLYGDGSDIGSSNEYMILLGSVLLIIGFVIFIRLYLKFILINQVMLDNRDYGVIESFKACSALMRGNKARLFYLGISFIGWIILGALSFGIGYLWIAPYINASATVFYLDAIGENMDGDSTWDDDIQDADVHFDEVG